MICRTSIKEMHIAKAATGLLNSQAQYLLIILVSFLSRLVSEHAQRHGDTSTVSGNNITLYTYIGDDSQQGW